MGRWLIVAVFSLFLLTNIHLASAASAVTITSPVNGTNTTDATPEIYFNVTGDNTTYVAQVWIDGAVSGSNFSATNSSVEAINLSVLTNGTSRISIEARNDTGGEAFVNSTLLTIFIDNQVPTITITSPVNGTNTSDSTPEIYFNVTDNQTTTLTYRVWKNFNNGSGVTTSLESAAVTSATNSSIIAFNLSNLVNGTYTFVVEANDTAGNVANSTPLQVFIDNQVPTITITSPVNNTNTSDVTPEFYFNVTDNQTTTLTYRVWVNDTLESAGVTAATNSSIIAFNLSTRVNGTSVIVVEVNDTAGNIVNSTPLHVTVDVTKPGLTLSLSATSVEIGRALTITCSASDDTTAVSSTTLTVTRPGGAVDTVSCGSSYSSTTEVGTYTVTFRATDLVGNTQETSTTFTSSDPGGTTGGTSSGGSSSTPAPPKKSRNIFTEMAVGVVHKVKIVDSDIGLKQISIEVNNKASNVEITVTKLDGKPAEVTKEVTGTVFQYLDIDQTNIPEADIKKVKIKFNVTKAWLNANNLDAATVALNRFTNNAWVKLSTTRLGESSTEVEYEAETPGFSTFAVSGTVSAQAPTTTIPSVTTTLPGATPTTTLSSATPESTSDDTTLILVGIFVLAAVVLSYFFFIGKGKKKHN